MRIRRISRHIIDGEEPYNTFNSQQYSGFKYGSCSQTSQVADNISDLLSTSCKDLKDKPILISSSAFKVVPTAANNLVNCMWNALQQLFPYSEQVDIRRGRVFPEDYATLSFLERKIVSQNAHLVVDTKKVTGQCVMIIDDVYCTGLHEQNIIKLLSPHASELIFVYLIEIRNFNNPTIESRLNQASVSSIFDLQPFINEGNYLLNARILKYILSYPDTTEFQRFLFCQSSEFIMNLHAAALDDGYDELMSNSSNWHFLDSLGQKNLVAAY